MIGYLEGKIIESTGKYLVIKAGSVGYEVFCPQTVLTICSVGDEKELWIQLIHREGSLELFGFNDQSSRALFRLLITISGIGPRSALGILDYNSPAELRTAISTGDISYLTKVSGIGKKTAEKILIELRDKMPVEESSDAPTASSDLIDVLLSMGYSLPQAREAARSTQNLADETVQAKLRAALQFLNS